jgi:transcriptional regulator with XRE-family HTH domain
MSTLISERMKEKGFATDAALAAAVKCDRSMVTRIKLGQVRPSLKIAVRLAKALDLPADAFLPEEAAS